jgi:hypothetical protein
VRKIDGSAFANTPIRSIKVASDSSNFRTDGSFLLDSIGGLVRYFGAEARVTINRSIIALRRYCFSDCDQLRQLLFESESKLVDIEEWVFSGCTDLELTDLPASLVTVHGSAFTATKITKISVAAGNPRLRVIDDFLIDITEAKLIRCFSSSAVIVLSRAVEIIGTYCFDTCVDLSNLTFEARSKLNIIERAAFLRCLSLKSMTIPASVTRIDGNVFALSGLVNVSIEEGNSHFCVIGQFLLDFTRTSLIAYLGTAATVTIDRNIRVLCDYCFADRTTLSRIEFKIDSDLRRIECGAFAGCTSLHTICIPSSIESLEREWFRLSCFYDGVVFDTVQFESAESLSTMLISDRADLSGDFDIEVCNWKGESQIAGYCLEAILPGNIARLKKSSDSVI